jgi:hypothetical protein
MSLETIDLLFKKDEALNTLFSLFSSKLDLLS